MLVTGGAGFIGAHFIQHYLQHDKNVAIINLDKLTYAGSLDKLFDCDPHRYQFVWGDIVDATLVANLLATHDIDTIVHFAAESHVDRSIATPSDFMQTNVIGTFTLLQAAKERWLDQEKRTAADCRFHHISTDEVFGSLTLGQAAFTEKTPYQPRSPYSASKAASDHLLQAYYHTYGLPITLSNCSNNYGPWQHAEKFIPTVIKSCLENRAIPIYGVGTNIRDWLYVKDHCRAIQRILTAGKVGESYVIGGKNEWSNLDLAELICQILDDLHPRQQSYASLLSFVPDRLGHDFRYAIDSSKIEQELLWTPQESLLSGLNKTIQFYLEHALTSQDANLTVNTARSG